LERFPSGSSQEQGFECLQLGGLDRTVELEVEIEASDIKNLGQKEFRLEAAVFDSLFYQVVPAPPSEADRCPRLAWPWKMGVPGVRRGMVHASEASRRSSS
jgi:hypothetical protein